MDADKILDAVKAKYEGAKRYGHGIAQDWAEGRKPRAVGKVILPCLPIIPLGLIVWLIVKNWDAIVTFFIGLAAVVCLAGGALSKVAKRKRTEEERQERLRQEAIRENARTADATYNKMANVVYEIARDLGPLGIVPPRMVSDIYSTGDRMISMQEGAVMLGLFTLQKSGDTVDTDMLSFTMQEKINKKLTAGELPGIDRNVTYKNRVYSGFVIDAVVDRPGFVEVYAVLTDENYIRFKMECEQSKSVSAPSVDRRDTDY